VFRRADIEMYSGMTVRTNSVDIIGSVFVWLGNAAYFLVAYPRDPLLDRTLFFTLAFFTWLSISNIYRKLQIDRDIIKFRSLLHRCEISIKTVASCEYCWALGGKGFRWYWLKFCDAKGAATFRFFFPGNLPAVKKAMQKYGIKTVGF
jgi:hypothetical protein